MCFWYDVWPVKRLRNIFASFACTFCLEAAAWGSLVDVSEMPVACPADVDVAREASVRAPNRTAIGLWAAFESIPGASAAVSASAEAASGRGVENRTRLWIVFDGWGESPMRGRFQLLFPAIGRSGVAHGAQDLASIRRTGVDLPAAAPPLLSARSISSGPVSGDYPDRTPPLAE